MSLVLALVLFVASEADPRSAVIEEGGVRVEVSVRSQIYRWTVSNVDAAPLVSLELGQYAMYNASGPPGWVVELDEGVLRARAEGPRSAIGPGDSAAFEARASSGGAVLGPVSCTIGLDDGAALEIPGVWGTTAEPRSGVALVASTLLLIAFGHAALLARRDRRRSPARR
ncbi:MAG: hypothetical protein ACYTJ0_06320 [Planctomycetota bacterium]|jgi:hypothetical protein